MTKREAAIVTAFTGVLVGEFDDFREYAQELLGEPVNTLDFANKEFTNKLRELSREDLIKALKENNEISEDSLNG